MNFTYLNQFIDEMILERTTGCAVSVFKEGKEIFRRFAGFSSIEEQKEFTGNELFYIYSCSKITAVVSALTLIEQGKLRLSDPLDKYIPAFGNMKVKTPSGEIVDAKNKITILNLFNMTAGFDYDLQASWTERASKITDGKFDTLETISCLAEKPLCFEPGTHWQYSLCHDVLAGVVSSISGMKYRDYVKKTIFEPLEMKDTMFHLPKSECSRMAEQYRFIGNGEDCNTDIVELQKSGNSSAGFFRNVGKDNQYILGTEYDSGGAGIITTLDDYSKFIAMLANSGIGINGKRVLSEQTINLMKTNTLTEELLKDFNWEQLKGYGYGLGVRSMLNPTISNALSPIGEFGWCGAAGAATIIDTDNKLSVFFVQHVLNPREEYYMPRLRDAIYAGLK